MRGWGQGHTSIHSSWVSHERRLPLLLESHRLTSDTREGRTLILVLTIKWVNGEAILLLLNHSFKLRLESDLTCIHFSYFCDRYSHRRAHSCYILWHHSLWRKTEGYCIGVISHCRFAFMHYVLNMCLTSYRADKSSVHTALKPAGIVTWLLSMSPYHTQSPKGVYACLCCLVYVCVFCICALSRETLVEFLMHHIPPPLTHVGWASDVFEKPHDNKKCAGNRAKIKLWVGQCNLSLSLG